jgi:hypothetical protein
MKFTKLTAFTAVGLAVASTAGIYFSYPRVQVTPDADVNRETVAHYAHSRTPGTAIRPGNALMAAEAPLATEAIENQFAAVTRRLSVMESRLARLQHQLSLEAKYGAEPFSVPDSEPESNDIALLIIDEQPGADSVHTSLENSFAADTRDKTWADNAESRIFTALAERDVGTNDVTVECRGTLCRADAVAGFAAVPNNTSLAILAAVVADQFSESYWIRESDGMQTIFFAREGTELPYDQPLDRTLNQGN